jgi:ribosomal protein S18 acetylase RimI-like enzyme
MHFKKFSQLDFDQYLPQALEHLGNEIAKARGVNTERALEIAKGSFESLFPQYIVDNQDQHIGHLVDNDSNIGIMHFGLKRDQSNPYIYLWDLEVFPPHRGNGYGKCAMEVLEQEAIRLGIQKISLNVFGHNIVARRLYEKMNYHPASLVMSKTLTK